MSSSVVSLAKFGSSVDNNKIYILSRNFRINIMKKRSAYDEEDERNLLNVTPKKNIKIFLTKKYPKKWQFHNKIFLHVNLFKFNNRI